MRVNIFLFFCAILIGAFAYFLQYSDEMDNCIAIISSTSITIPLLFLLAVSYPKRPRTTVSFKIISSFLLLVLLVINGIFYFMDIAQKGYLIANGLSLLLGVILLYIVVREKQ